MVHPLHTALRLVYFFRNSDPNAEIYLPNLFQWEECNPFFLVHWDKKIKSAWKKLYKNNSSVLEGFITKAKWGKKNPKQNQNNNKKISKKKTQKPQQQKNQDQPKSKKKIQAATVPKKSWQQPVRSVMLPYKVQTPTHPKHTACPPVCTEHPSHPWYSSPGSGLKKTKYHVC